MKDKTILFISPIDNLSPLTGFLKTYVKAVIVTEINSLQIYLGDELVDQFNYQLTA